ncbi:3-oxoacyl-[acyl-carrier-protein] reductase FabG [Toxocara canis]|uniref:3-oxoacyl-[acyl-carrier-protein] reductase FabG n=1 Tax=Toxocara canis TaxID=6265 RepID=A0A0B2VNC4_TOXCA|nr:3-oxoacyl-[acyl-carrier-protein] reductase FabG [Toxocara canis]
MANPVVNLSGKVALITGATSGIGRATAVLFNKLGASIVITGRATERLQALADELSKNGLAETYPVTADLTKEEDIKSLADATIKKFNKLDILVNNAGILENGTIENTTLEQFDHMISVNLRAVFYLTNLLCPHLIESKGAIVNVSSVNGMRSFPNVLAYNISKAGVDQLTRCAALELAPKGVRVNCVNPGVTLTELHRRSGMNDASYAAFVEHSKSTHALGRAGNPEEVANAIAFLASGAASFITGASLPVDGGRHAMCPRRARGVSAEEEEHLPSNDVDDNGFFALDAPVLTPPDNRSPSPSLEVRSSRRIAERTGGRYPNREVLVRRRYSPGLPGDDSLPRSRLGRSVERKPPPIVLIPKRRPTAIVRSDESPSELNTKPPLLLKSAADVTDGVSLRRHIEEQDRIIAHVTRSPVFRAKFIGSIVDVPVALLLRHGPLDVEVCDCVPKIRLLGYPVSLSFIVDTTKVNPADLCFDGLGPWNVRGGARLSMTKFFFNKEKAKCAPGSHDFCVQRKAYVHPHCVPPNSIKKIIWQITKEDDTCRYALITYCIAADAYVDGVPRIPVAVKSEFMDAAGMSHYGPYRGMQPFSSLHNRLNQDYGAEFEDTYSDYDHTEEVSASELTIREHMFRRRPLVILDLPPLDDDMLYKLTFAPVYKQVYVHSINSVPLDLLLQEQLDETVPVCTFVPKLNPLGCGAAVTFVVDTTKVPICDLSTDNLGAWNSKEGRRMNVRKFYYKEKSKGSEGDHDFCVVQRVYVHPYCRPPESVRKMIWIVKKEGVYCRYALISYYLAPGSDIPPLPHGNSKNNRMAYVRKFPSEVVRRSMRGLRHRTRKAERSSSAAGMSDFDDNAEVNVEETSDDEASEINVDGSPRQQNKFFAVSDEEMSARIAQLTDAIPFTRTFIASINALPIDLLRAEVIAEDTPVNRMVPQIHLTGIGAQMSFLVDSARLPISEVGNDNLGTWNAKEGKRMSVIKFFYDREGLRCTADNHEYCIYRRKYSHPYCDPPNSIARVMWQCKRADGSYTRYTLLSYSIDDGASLILPVNARRSQHVPVLLPDDEQALSEEIARLTSDPVYRRRFINSINDLPIDILLQPWNLNEPVCTAVPHLDIVRSPTEMAVQLAFLVDTTRVAVTDLSTDNLGQWNASQGRRMTMRKFFYNRDKLRCVEGEHDFVITRKTYVHPNALPDGTVRKIIWQLSSEHGYSRYALVTYDIGANAMVEALPHGNSRTKMEAYQRKEPSILAEMKSRKEDEKSKRHCDLRKRTLLDAEEEGLVPKQVKRPASIAAPSSITLYEEGIDDEMTEGYPLTHEDVMERMAQPSMRRFTRPYHNDEPFNVVFLGDLNVGLVQCASCGVDFSQHAMPPEDIVLEHVERFWNQRTGAFSTQQMQKRYIHARLDCVLSRYDYFTTVDFLAISDDVRERLTDLHQQCLSEEFGCSFG